MLALSREKLEGALEISKGLLLFIKPPFFVVFVLLIQPNLKKYWLHVSSTSLTCRYGFLASEEHLLLSGYYLIIGFNAWEWRQRDRDKNRYTKQKNVNGDAHVNKDAK